MVPSLKLTCSLLKMDGWKTFSFPFGMAYFFFNQQKGKNMFLHFVPFFWMEKSCNITHKSAFFLKDSSTVRLLDEISCLPITTP